MQKKLAFLTTDTAVVFACFFIELMQQCDNVDARKVRVHAIERVQKLELDVLSKKI